MLAVLLLLLTVPGGSRRAQAQPSDDGTTAEGLLRQIERGEPGTPRNGPAAPLEAHRVLTAEAIAQAKNALERSARLRAAGDEAHARAADGLAREYAETARDLLLAAKAEAAAAEFRRKAVEEQARLERARALVEEAIARVGRLKAVLDEAERAPGHGRTAVEVHEGEPAPAKKGKPTKAAPVGAP